MVFLQYLYGLVLEEHLQVSLGDVSKRAWAEMISMERKHRCIR